MKTFISALLVVMLFSTGINAMSESLKKIEVNLVEDPDAAVIWLHGLGASGDDFEPIVPELGLPADARVRFIFPHAPGVPVTINNGYVMPAWYDIYVMNLGEQQDEQGIRGSQEKINKLIEAEIERGIAPERIVLAGFSQGGAIVLQTGLRYPKRLGGIMVLSSYVPLQQSLHDEKHPVNQDVPIYYGHGRQDEVISIEHARQSHRLLVSEGYSVEWNEYDMPHSVIPDQIDDIGDWLRRVLKLN